MFERDKEELRELGIPLETGSDGGWDGEVGYRIARRDYELPEIDLAPDEAAAIGLAARLWQSAEMAQAVSRAMLKLQAAGVDVAPRAALDLEPRVDATEPAFAPCLAAVQQGRVIRFGYRGAGGAELTRRELEPWGVVSWHGHWYVVGHDRIRAATRVFRLSRVSGSVEVVGPAGAVVAPAGVDLAGAVADLAATTGTFSARLLVRPGAAVSLRRDATSSSSGADGWDEVTVPYADPERLADRVAGYGADVVLLDPAEARTAVISRLRALADPVGAGA